MPDIETDTETDTETSGRAPALSSSESAILDVLARSTGRVLGRVSIMRMANIDHCTSRRCDTAIVSLRKVLGADSIMTVRRRGWMLTDAGLARVREMFGENPTTPG